MLGRFISRSTQLNLRLTHSIVIRYQKKRSMFDKTAYNPEWVPRLNPYSKHRAPPMRAWTDPNVVVPYQIPPLHKKINYRTLIKSLVEREQREKSLRSREYLMESIRAGDIVDITYQETFASVATVTHRAYVLAFKRRNSLTAALEVAIRLGGMNIKAIYLIHSPKVKGIKIVSMGSGNFRANLKNRWGKLGKTEIARARIRNRVMKLREGGRRKVKSRKFTAMEFNQIKSDNVKRII